MPVTSNATEDTLRASRDEQRVELTFETRGGTELVALKYSTWVDGLGWCCQKTIRLDGDQLDDLHRAITVARHRLTRRRAEAGEVVKPARVIRLSTVA